MNIIKNICIKYTYQGIICISARHIYRKGVYYFALQDQERKGGSFSGIPERDTGRTDTERQGHGLCTHAPGPTSLTGPFKTGTQQFRRTCIILSYFTYGFT